MNNQQPKPDPKGKAIASFVLGIVSLMPVVMFLFMQIIPFGAPNGGTMAAILFLYFIGFVSIFTAIGGLVGLILGIKGLKSTKRNFAIIGVILCIIGLLTCLLPGLFLVYPFFAL